MARIDCMNLQHRLHVLFICRCLMSFCLHNGLFRDMVLFSKYVTSIHEGVSFSVVTCSLLWSMLVVQGRYLFVTCSLLKHLVEH